MAVLGNIVPTQVTLHGNPLPDVQSCIRAALAQLGELQVELLQPMYGPSTHMEFFKEHGQGIHHISFGVMEDHDQDCINPAKKGITTEMQGLMDGTFTYLNTLKELGAFIEVAKLLQSPGAPRTIFPWGRYTPPGPGVINMEGKRIVQIGIIVEDVEKSAQRQVTGISLVWALAVC